jgi:hypothetical protein
LAFASQWLGVSDTATVVVNTDFHGDASGVDEAKVLADAQKRQVRKHKMTTGTIKHFKSERGFGFISEDNNDGYNDGYKEHFFHVSAIVDKSRGAPVTSGSASLWRKIHTETAGGRRRIIRSDLRAKAAERRLEIAGMAFMGGRNN